MSTTVWQPLPDGPVITIAPGSKSVPVTSVDGFAVGEKIALGHGATFPYVGRTMEKYEVATVTAIGKAGTQAWLAVDALPGEKNLKVTSVGNITAGDKIRLDIDSVDHGIETVTVTRVGTQAGRAKVSADASAGATRVMVRGRGNLNFTVGDKLTVGTPANQETVSITAVGAPGQSGVAVDVSPALAKKHLAREDAVAHGTGLDIAEPLKFKHAANMPFSARGTGISFQPPTAFAHLSNEPVRPLGTGITLDKPLAKAHAIDSAVRDAQVTTAGYQGTPGPDLWFGGPALSTTLPGPGGNPMALNAGSMVLRDAGGLVVDSVNYGGLIDPWAAEGYQAESGTGKGGCSVPAPAAGRGFGPSNFESNRSAGRFPDGADTDSNCVDFLVQAATTLPAGSAAGATNVKVASVANFAAGQTVMVGLGADMETAVIATVGTPGVATTSAALDAGATVVPVTSAMGFSAGQTITVGSGREQESAVIASTTFNPRASTLTLTSPLTRGHAAGAAVSGSGITLTAPLRRPHTSGAQFGLNLPTPGGPNRFSNAK